MEYSFNQPGAYFEIGKDGIVKDGIFKRFSELIPAVGDHYWREDGKHGKLLLVNEGNHLNDYPESINVFKNADKYYTAGTDKLVSEEMALSVSDGIGYNAFNKVFNIMDKVLDEAGIEHEHGLVEAAFYNYFLHPALNIDGNKCFTPQEIDIDVSGAALIELLRK